MGEKNLVCRLTSEEVFNITGVLHTGKSWFFSDKATGYFENGKVVFDPGYDNVAVNIPVGITGC